MNQRIEKIIKADGYILGSEIYDELEKTIAEIKEILLNSIIQRGNEIKVLKALDSSRESGSPEPQGQDANCLEPQSSNEPSAPKEEGKK